MNMRSDAKSLFYTQMQTPVGQLKLIAHRDALVAVLWEHELENRVKLADVARDDQHRILIETQRQLAEYFAGRRQQFNLPLDSCGTDFQRQVWQALLTIPFGETRSYKHIAEQIGNVKAVRAVGAANGRNPISIIVPCHRVVGANGKLVGFAGGIQNKQILLKLEK